MRLRHQLRLAPRGVVGFDMNAALGLASALGVPQIAVAELLPAIEASAVARMNEGVEDG